MRPEIGADPHEVMIFPTAERCQELRGSVTKSVVPVQFGRGSAAVGRSDHFVISLPEMPFEVPWLDNHEIQFYTTGWTSFTARVNR